MDVPQTIVDAIQKRLAAGSIAKTNHTARGFEIHIVASDGGPGALTGVDREVSEAVRELRRAGDLVEELQVIVATWY